MVTRKEVALKAGVSEATVSHVINDTKFVSSELKQKVEEAIKLLNYTPNMVARSLVTKQSKHVGILVNDIKNPYYGEIAEGMEEIARENGYIVSLCLASGNPDEYLNNIVQRQMEGLFIACTSSRFSADQIQKPKEAGVIIINGVKGEGSHIEFNYSSAVFESVEHLAKMGHTRIGFLSGIKINEEHLRFTYYREALKKHGLSLDDDLVVDGTYPYYTTHKSGYESMKILLQRETRITAVLATNDLMAFGAMKAIKEAGLRIPEDMSIIGCDDIFLSECTEPPLTTIRPPKKEFGRQAMYLMIKELSEKKHGIVTLDCDLVIRQSTGKAPSI